MFFVRLQLQDYFTDLHRVWNMHPPDEFHKTRNTKKTKRSNCTFDPLKVMTASKCTLMSHSSLSAVINVFTCGRREWLIFLALSNYKVNQTKTVRNCCRCTGLMFPASFWLNVGSGCRSHAGYCFHILCSLSNGLLKTGFLLFWPHWLQSGIPWHCFPFLVDRRRGRRCRRRRKKWNLSPPPLSVISRRWVLMQTLCACGSVSRGSSFCYCQS